MTGLPTYGLFLASSSKHVVVVHRAYLRQLSAGSDADWGPELALRLDTIIRWNRRVDNGVTRGVRRAECLDNDIGHRRSSSRARSGCCLLARLMCGLGNWQVSPMAAVLVMFELLFPLSGQAASASRVAMAAPCTVALLDKAAGTWAEDHFTQVSCAKGWGLAVGPKGAASTVGVFRERSEGWEEVRALAAESSGPRTLQFAGVGINPVLLMRLARPFAPPVRQLVSAGALVEELATREAKLGATGSYQASNVLEVRQRSWFALAGAETAPPPLKDQNVGTAVYADSVLSVYVWRAAGWALSGTVRGWMGPVMAGCCGITATLLTGSHDPDFALTSGGAADTNWLAVVSDAGGAWHLVPFSYGYTLTTVVNGQPVAHGVSTMVDATSSAAGPTTFLFEKYERGVFRPATPPGPAPLCTRAGLMGAADPEGAVPGYLSLLELDRFACADGWALASGTGPGYTGRVVGLFEANNEGRVSSLATTSWRTVELDNGDSLGSFPAIYDIPLSLLRKLANALGPELRPELATASLVAAPAMTGVPADEVLPDGVLPVAGRLWFVTETQTGSIEAPGARASIYRWSGKGWQLQGRVDQVPNSLNAFAVGFDAWFEAITVEGAQDPGFVVESSGSAPTSVLTDVGGTWHVARYKAEGP